MRFMRLFPEAATAFVDSGVCRTPASRASYLRELRALDQFAKGVTLDQYTTRLLTEYCLSNGPAPATAKRRRSQIVGFFEWATWMELVPANPASSLKFTVKPGSGGVRAHSWLGEAEIAHIIRACPDTPAGRRDRVMLLHGFLLGLRRFEIAGLRWNQYSQDMSRLSFVGKGNKLAQLGVPPQLRAELQAWCREAPADAVAVLPRIRDTFDEQVISWNEPVAYGSIGWLMDRAAARAGITLAPHDMRRSYAGVLEQAGVPVSDIQRLMRHSNLGTTSVYLEKNPNRTAALADNFTIAL